MKKLLICFAAMIIIAGLSVNSNAYFIDFENDVAGYKSNGWQSVGSNLVSFTDSNGSNLEVNNFGSQGKGKSLAVRTDYDDSWLIMNFGQGMNSLSLDFGNDDPGWSNPGDQALLKLFYDNSQVGSVAVTMNRNDIMDQSISYSGVYFNSATFYYAVNPAQGLIEIVDNINFSGGTPQVPEPGTMMLLGSLAAGLFGFAGVKKIKE